MPLRVRTRHVLLACLLGSIEVSSLIQSSSASSHGRRQRYPDPGPEPAQHQWLEPAPDQAPGAGLTARPFGDELGDGAEEGPGLAGKASLIQPPAVPSDGRGPNPLPDLAYLQWHEPDAEDPELRDGTKKMSVEDGLVDFGGDNAGGVYGYEGDAVEAERDLRRSLDNTDEEGEQLPEVKRPKANSHLSNCDGLECVEKYLKTPDPYDWHDTGVQLTGSSNGVTWTGHVLNMTSLRWENPAVVDFPDWWHILVVVVPSNLKYQDWSTMTLDFGVNYPNSSLLRIDNRKNFDPVELAIQPNTAIDRDNLEAQLPVLKASTKKAAHIATSTRSIATSVLCLPNAYETFYNDVMQRHRAMDFLKAYTYRDFIYAGGQDPTRIIELPITKASVRAMDTVSAFTNGQVKRFGVAAYSKLASVTWMLGAVDPRVEVITPASINLDISDLFPIQSLIRKLGRKDGMAAAREIRRSLVRKPKSAKRELATNRKLIMAVEYLPVFEKLASPAAARLHRIVDPVAWGNRIHAKKHFAMGSNDDLFIDLTRTNHWWGSISGPKSFNEIPNCEHEESLLRNLDTTSSYILGHLAGKNTPEIEWGFDEGSGRIHVRQTSKHAPMSVIHWWSDTNGSSIRDFSGSVWSSKELHWSPGKDSAVFLSTPRNGFAASFIELKYLWPDRSHMYALSTGVSVMPPN